MLFEIRFSGDSNLKDSKFYFVQPYLALISNDVYQQTIGNNEKLTIFYENAC